MAPWVKLKISFSKILKIKIRVRMIVIVQPTVKGPHWIVSSLKNWDKLSGKVFTSSLVNRVSARIYSDCATEN